MPFLGLYTKREVDALLAKELAKERALVRAADWTKQQCVHRAIDELCKELGYQPAVECTVTTNSGVTIPSGTGWHKP